MMELSISSNMNNASFDSSINSSGFIETRKSRSIYGAMLWEILE